MNSSWATLVVLTLLNLLNYVDRYVLPAVTESVKKELRLDDVQIGLLATGFVVVLVITSPVFGVMADRWVRTRLVALGAALWSVATASTALAGTFSHVFAARMGVGVGEAAYGTVVPSLLSDIFPRKVRGRVFAVFYAAIPVGAALGYLAGGWISHHYGWRAAFLYTGAPGLLLAWAALKLREPERGCLDDPEAGAHGPPDWRKYRELLGNRLYLLTVLGYTAGTFALGGLGFWMPSFLQRERGFSQTDADLVFGQIMGLGSFIGSLSGGWIADLLLKRTRQAYLWLAGMSTMMAVPFTMAGLVSHDRTVFLSAMFVASVLLFMSTGPINAMLVNSVAPEMRGAAIGLCTVSIHLLGDAVSPPIIGAISDASSIGKAVLTVPAAVAVAGVIWTATAFREDRRA